MSALGPCCSILGGMSPPPRGAGAPLPPPRIPHSMAQNGTFAPLFNIALSLPYTFGTPPSFFPFLFPVEDCNKVPGFGAKARFHQLSRNAPIEPRDRNTAYECHNDRGENGGREGGISLSPQGHWDAPHAQPEESPHRPQGGQGRYIKCQE